MSLTTEELIATPHGEQQSIKIKLLELIQQGLDPYKILYALADHLEEISAEKGYADHIKENIYTIYGIALQEEEPLKAEIANIHNRIAKISSAILAEEKGDKNEELLARMNFALRAHQARKEQLEGLLT